MLGCRIFQVVLCFSPVGSTLRQRSRKFPAIINCTAINYFNEWPRTALESVAKKFLTKDAALSVGLQKKYRVDSSSKLNLSDRNEAVSCRANASFPLLSLQPEMTDSIAVFMAFVLGSVNEVSKNYLSNEKRHNYTTPKSYLELIALYTRLLREKTDDHCKRIQRLENGLIRLAQCSHQVDSLKVAVFHSHVHSLGLQPQW